MRGQRERERERGKGTGAAEESASHAKVTHTHTHRHSHTQGESDTHMNELLSHVCACLAFIEKYLQLVGSGALFQAVFEA